MQYASIYLDLGPSDTITVERKSIGQRSDITIAITDDCYRRHAVTFTLTPEQVGQLRREFRELDGASGGPVPAGVAEQGQP